MNMWIFLVLLLFVAIILIIAAKSFKYKIEKEESEDFIGRRLLLYVVYRKNVFSKWTPYRTFRSMDDAVTYLEKKTKQPY